MLKEIKEARFFTEVRNLSRERGLCNESEKKIQVVKKPLPTIYLKSKTIVAFEFLGRL